MPDCKTVSRIEQCFERIISRRRLIFACDIVWIVILGIVGWVLLQKNNCILSIPPANQIDWSKVTIYCVFWTKYKLFFNCMWMGSLGGIAVSLKGVYDHGASYDPWKNDYNLWHVGRPISGAIAGLIAGFLLYLIIPTEKFSHVVVYGVAFIFGMQDKAFFDFLAQFAARFLPPSQPTAPVLQITGIDPAKGKGGATVRITGQAIDKTAVVRIGGKPLNGLAIAPDGTSATGTVAQLGLAAGTKVDLAIVNPGGRSIVLLDKFEYLGD